MAVTNPFSITYGSREVGGSTSYQLHGPYVIDKNFERLRVAFDVVVVGTSYATLQSLSDALETDFRKRDQSFSISLSGSTWTYTRGSTVLNTRASIVKSGNPESDRGFSRAYTCSIEGDLPADDANGLRELEVLVNFESSRQRIVTMRGAYTALSGTNAVAKYRAEFDAEAATLLAFVDADATFELVRESHDIDRNRASGSVSPHLCSFTRQYVELLADQSQGHLDDTSIRDHRVTFTDMSQHPGDSAADVHRLRRVVGSYDCSVDIDTTTDLQQTFESKVRPHLTALFQSTFEPQVFALEEHRVSYDETSKRMSITFQFLYQASGGGNLVEISQSVAYREMRTIDYTPVHGKDELAAEADVGWMILERVWSRTAIYLGEANPVLRVANSNVNSSGWNILANTSQVTPQWIGDSSTGLAQIRVSVLNETVVERYHRKPSGGNTASPVTPTSTPGPITGGPNGPNGPTTGPITPGR